MCCCNDHSVLESLLREIRDTLNNMWSTWTGMFNTIQNALIDIYDLLRNWINRSERDVCIASTYVRFRRFDDPSANVRVGCSCNPRLGFLREMTIHNMLPDTVYVAFPNPDTFGTPGTHQESECYNIGVYVPPYGVISFDTRGNMRLPLEAIFDDSAVDLVISTLGESGASYTHPNDKVYITAVWYSG